VGAEQVAVDFVSNRHDHTYEATFFPTISGTWQVNVTFATETLLGSNDRWGDHIAGSPFMVQTSPYATFAQESYATVIHHGVAGVLPAPSTSTPEMLIEILAKMMGPMMNGLSFSVMKLRKISLSVRFSTRKTADTELLLSPRGRERALCR